MSDIEITAYSHYHGWSPGEADQNIGHFMDSIPKPEAHLQADLGLVTLDKLFDNTAIGPEFFSQAPDTPYRIVSSNAILMQPISAPFMPLGCHISKPYMVPSNIALTLSPSHGIRQQEQNNHYLPQPPTAEPPDIYQSLNEAPPPPPPEDMNPTDMGLVPYEQELRFKDDLYTPKWVRGYAKKREGWCGFCNPGRWLALKNSNYWYDKVCTHGISAATGKPFRKPQETRRVEGDPPIWEGQCARCNKWITLAHSPKKGRSWFHHAHKCHRAQMSSSAAVRSRPTFYTTEETDYIIYARYEKKLTWPAVEKAYNLRFPQQRSRWALRNVCIKMNRAVPRWNDDGSLIFSNDDDLEPEHIDIGATRGNLLYGLTQRYPERAIEYEWVDNIFKDKYRGWAEIRKLQYHEREELRKTRIYEHYEIPDSRSGGRGQ